MLLSLPNVTFFPSITARSRQFGRNTRSLAGLFGFTGKNQRADVGERRFFGHDLVAMPLYLNTD